MLKRVNLFLHIVHHWVSLQRAKLGRCHLTKLLRSKYVMCWNLLQQLDEAGKINYTQAAGFFARAVPEKFKAAASTDAPIMDLIAGGCGSEIDGAQHTFLFF